MATNMQPNKIRSNLIQCQYALKLWLLNIIILKRFNLFYLI